MLKISSVQQPLQAGAADQPTPLLHSLIDCIQAALAELPAKARGGESGRLQHLQLVSWRLQERLILGCLKALAEGSLAPSDPVWP